MKISPKFLLAFPLSAIGLFCGAAYAKSPAPVKVDIKTAQGADAGTAMLSSVKGGVKIKLDLKGLPPGEHAVNSTVKPDGTDKISLVEKDLSLDPSSPNSLFANGGTAIMIHEKADDMMTDPTGNAGARIACGVITASQP
jgi:Cu-Zn family superoxide dismutase